jgi:hypothetical protein
MMRLFRSAAWAAGMSFALLVMGAGQAAGEVIVIGGDGGANWESGGGDIPATVIRNINTVETTNAPGGVIDFDTADRPNWIQPQRADTTQNIALGLDSQLRGGSINSPNNVAIRSTLGNVIDDDGDSALDLRASAGNQSARVLGLIIDLDLGARFGINRFKFFPRNADPGFPSPDFPFQNEFLRGFEIFINDGTSESQFQGIPILTTVAIEPQNDESVVDLRIPPQYVRFVRLKVLATAGFDMAEFQVFGTGFVPEARYVSNIFDFGDLALFGNLRWVEDREGDATLSGVQIRTRTGDDQQPVEFTKVRPGERIFRVGGGAQSGNTAGISTANIEVPWKPADDVDDAELKTLITDVLDNDEVDVREAVGIFKDLPLAQQALITLDEDDYDDLRNEDRGAIRDDITNWSGWSPPYSAAGIVEEGLLQVDGAGVPITSPGPRRYFQFTVDFSSENFDAAAAVGGLAFDVISPPFAEQLVAEISPRTAEVGKTTRFLYAVRSQAQPGQQRGFDRFEVETPLRVEEIGAVRIRAADGSVQEADFSGVLLDNLPVTRGDFTIEEVEDTRFLFSFPLIESDATVLEIEFDNGVLRFGTTFAGRAFNSALQTTIGQQALPGNASDLTQYGFEDPDVQPVGALLDANLSVAVPISKNLLANVTATPPVFTPNGDGTNDRAAVRYDITNIARQTPVKVLVFDLSGRLVRHLLEETAVSGRFAQDWDGRDDSGVLVPPGNYIYSVSLRAGAGEEKEVGVIAVAY